jgi:nitrogen PTS system EIIA component
MPMDMRQLIAPEDVIGLRAKGKMQLLQELARRAAKSLGIEVRPILKALTAREELGSTGVGHGIALPHARIPGLARLFSLFARLEKPIEFDAVDARPVDLVFLLLVPANADKEHLAALASVSRCLRDPETARRLRATSEPHALYDVLAGTVLRGGAAAGRT